MIILSKLAHCWWNNGVLYVGVFSSHIGRCNFDTFYIFGCEFNSKKMHCYALSVLFKVWMSCLRFSISAFCSSTVLLRVSISFLHSAMTWPSSVFILWYSPMLATNVFILLLFSVKARATIVMRRMSVGVHWDITSVFSIWAICWNRQRSTSSSQSWDYSLSVEKKTDIVTTKTFTLSVFCKT